MSMLHTVNKSPFEKSSLDSCLRYATPGSTLLLYEDGVYAALKGTVSEQKMKSALQNHKVFVLGADLKARGFADDRVVDGIRIVGYGDFVDLAAEADKVQAWV